MRVRQIVVVSAIALGLAGSGAAAANAAGLLPGSEGTPGGTTACPAPGGAGVDTIEARDGKIYHNGELVGEAKPGEPIAVTRDGKVHIGADAAALPKPPDAEEHLVTSGSGAGGEGADTKGFVCRADGDEQ
ncbi:hypothetical protein I6A84_09295 [Frankia sp. CNm7]|uniref:Uncharacterized protein n=1 Tax=Frankia nepalensis TaxID=1836974 RepID=A0A937RPY8_9ACTN|nr:hypothetical protein [Frankia nepalensis]MBL7497777.1 hypothetical protein [Frankia nepalensis]MBL7511280.1 hypothetical protein [Frankia nepalensis]MBL7518299.1 hypothetical protein [Frankia nepalensis]MBL7629846.1 hypothetical protein [Frankia nepalensis]